MKVLVTGGSGMIGTATLRALVADGHEVVNVDRAPTRAPARYYAVDIKDSAAVQEIFAKEQPDAVLHLAAQISVPASVRDPIGDMQENILGSLSVFEAARAHGTKRVMVASSAAAYGDGAKPPISEDTPLVPNSPYGVAKVAIEQYLRGFYREFYTYAVLRYGNVYGPEQDAKKGAAIAKMTHDAVTSGRIQVDGDGTQVRDFVHVEDIAQLNIAALTNRENLVVNVGTGHPVQLLDLVRLIEEHLGRAVQIDHTPTRPGDIHTSYYDVSHLQQVLSWQPKISLSAGIRQMVEAQLAQVGQ